MPRPLDQARRGLTDFEWELFLILKKYKEYAFTVDELISKHGVPQSVSETEKDFKERYKAALNSLVQRKMVNIHFVANKENYSFNSEG